MPDGDGIVSLDANAAGARYAASNPDEMVYP
jgi:hypothetical protein